MGGRVEQALRHFRRAVELAHGQRAAPYLAVATTVAVQRQDQALFQEMLDTILAVDVDQAPAWRLENRIAQEQAAWLLDHRQDLFADPEETAP
jgi:predicted anti-sigma-YlaC factor YlaD